MNERQPVCRADELHLILMATEACNFRCTYCYELPGGRRMSAAVVRGVERFLGSSIPDLRRLTLSWFGGEPLLARGVIEQIMARVNGAIAREGRPVLASDITTNGHLLTANCCERLLELGITQFQVSLDGTREWHDRTRTRAGGRGSYDRVWGNLCGLRALAGDFTVILRLHVHGRNAASAPRFIDDFAAAFGTDRRFRLFLRPLSCLQKSPAADLDYLRGPARRRVIDMLARNARQQGLEPMTPATLPPVCYAARGNSFVVRADGRLAKCTVALDDPANDIGRLDEYGMIELDVDRTRTWMRGFTSGLAHELQCPWRGLAHLPV